MEAERAERSARLFGLTAATAQVLLPTVWGPRFAEEEQPPNVIQPASYAFAVCLPIFATSIGYAGLQARGAGREGELMRAVGWPLAAALVPIVLAVARTVADPVGDPRKEWQARRMRIEEWWPKLDPATREWLIANNGDVVPITVLGQIAEAGGDVTSEASSIGDNSPDGFLLSDAAVDWIEETANHETDSGG